MTCEIKCRENCGACCIAPSITTSFLGMPNGKPAGKACIHLLEDMRCDLFNSPLRPAFCKSLKPTKEMCGNNREEALAYLTNLEQETNPENRLKP